MQRRAPGRPLRPGLGGGPERRAGGLRLGPATSPAPSTPRPASSSAAPTPARGAAAARPPGGHRGQRPGAAGGRAGGRLLPRLLPRGGGGRRARAWPGAWRSWPAFWIAVGLMLASYFLIRIARPLEQVVEAAERLGEESGVQLPVPPDRELADLVHGREPDVAPARGAARRRTSGSSPRWRSGSSRRPARCCAPTGWPPWAASPPASPTSWATRST